jgi:hypothetical protein
MSAATIIVGVTGSIAAYKAAELVSKLVKGAFEVHVVMTHGAQQFVAPLTFQTLSRHPVITSVFEGEHGWKPGHIDLAERADLLLVAPATANIIAELAHGLASNPLTEIALATARARRRVHRPGGGNARLRVRRNGPALECGRDRGARGGARDEKKINGGQIASRPSDDARRDERSKRAVACGSA